MTDVIKFMRQVTAINCVETPAFQVQHAVGHEHLVSLKVHNLTLAEALERVWVASNSILSSSADARVFDVSPDAQVATPNTAS